MDKRIKYSTKQKLSAVRSVIEGKASATYVASKISTGKTTVQRWVNLYRQLGKEGLKLQHGSYSSQFKVGTINHMIKNQFIFDTNSCTL